MGKSAWRDWVDLDPGDDGFDPVLASQSVGLMDRPSKGIDAPREAMLYFGAQVGWSPLRESGRGLAVEWACDLATRDVLVVELCSECLSGFGDVTLGDRVVCAGCLHYSRDHRVAELLRSSPPPPPDKAANPNNVGVDPPGKAIRFQPKGS